MEVCASCRKDLSVERRYWQRRFPDVVVCRACWISEDAASPQIVRDSVAQIICEARKKDRATAQHALKRLRGTGVPANPKRGHASTKVPPTN